MEQAFLIMQFGNAQLDQVYAEVFRPAIVSCGLDPKRVDKHNQGGILKTEIDTFIQQAEIIVADLTNERPNCYIEVGYAMGLGKFTNVILSARQDHNPTHPTHIKGGPRIHFDLAGYDILFWDPSNLPAFRRELEARIQRRLPLIAQKKRATAPRLAAEDPLVTVSFNGSTTSPGRRWVNLLILNSGQLEAMDVKCSLNKVLLADCGTISPGKFADIRKVEVSRVPIFNNPEISTSYIDRKASKYSVTQRGYVNLQDHGWYPYSSPSAVEKDGQPVFP